VDQNQVAHARLWELITNRKVMGLTFRPKERIEGYIVDFCCQTQKIIIELSEFPFEDPNKIDLTMKRHMDLIEEGYAILSFDPRTVMEKPHYIYDMICTHVQMNESSSPMSPFDLEWD
jgi:very-short-patch-repair endonuclease